MNPLKIILHKVKQNIYLDFNHNRITIDGLCAWERLLNRDLCIKTANKSSKYSCMKYGYNNLRHVCIIYLRWKVQRRRRLLSLLQSCHIQQPNHSHFHPEYEHSSGRCRYVWRNYSTWMSDSSLDGPLEYLERTREILFKFSQGLLYKPNKIDAQWSCHG